jgi:outer membrane protein OmpA-like peptidoglycan-associated protein
MLVSILLLVLFSGGASAQIVVQTGRPAERQAGFRFEGAHVEVGLVNPKSGKNAVMAGASVSLGTLLTPWLDWTASIHQWTADIDRSAFDSRVGGQFSDTSIRSELVYNFFSIKGFRPSVLCGLAGHFIGADIPDDRSLEDALSGFNLGADIGLGLATTRPGLGFRFTARRDIVEDAGNWSYLAGIGWWPRTRARAPVKVAAAVPATPGTLLLPGQAVTPTPAPVAQAASDPQITELRAGMATLMRQNESMRAQMDSLRQVIAEKAVTAPASPLPPPAVPVAPEPEPKPSDRQQLKSALERLAALASQPGALRETADGFMFSLDRALLFKTGSSDLQVAAQEQLRRLAAVLLRFPQVSVVVEGHTDSAGNPDSNRRLSERRADAVLQELVRLGVNPTQIQAMGYGSSQPIGDNNTMQGRALNRRVEIRITPPADDAED